VAGLDASPWPVVEALALAETRPGWPAGQRYYYSNIGYALLGLVLEGVAGCSYAQAIGRHVLDPCGMTASEAVTTAQAQARAATGHLQLADGSFVPAPWVPTAGGAGSTLCTVADLGRFLRALVAGEPALLDPDTYQLMTTPALGLSEQEAYGYGLGVEIDREAGYRRIGHSGDCPGFGSHAYGCAETGVGVVALYNGPWRRRSHPASTWPIVEHGLALLRAAALGQELPADPLQGPAAVPAGPTPRWVPAELGTTASGGEGRWVPVGEHRLMAGRDGSSGHTARGSLTRAAQLRVR
jgi:CubicO group peptidase (beta-lactamase class C family)